jgi:hypothetical protein
MPQAVYTTPALGTVSYTHHLFPATSQVCFSLLGCQLQCNGWPLCRRQELPACHLGVHAGALTPQSHMMTTTMTQENVWCKRASRPSGGAQGLLGWGDCQYPHLHGLGQHFDDSRGGVDAPDLIAAYAGKQPGRAIEGPVHLGTALGAGSEA